MQNAQHFGKYKHDRGRSSPMTPHDPAGSNKTQLLNGACIDVTYRTFPGSNNDSRKTSLSLLLVGRSDYGIKRSPYSQCISKKQGIQLSGRVSSKSCDAFRKSVSQMVRWCPWANGSASDSRTERPSWEGLMMSSTGDSVIVVRARPDVEACHIRCMAWSVTSHLNAFDPGGALGVLLIPRVRWEWVGRMTVKDDRGDDVVRRGAVGGVIPNT